MFLNKIDLPYKMSHVTNRKMIKNKTINGWLILSQEHFIGYVTQH